MPALGLAFAISEMAAGWLVVALPCRLDPASIAWAGRPEARARRAARAEEDNLTTTTPSDDEG
jgi:hypothetical protein